MSLSTPAPVLILGLQPWPLITTFLNDLPPGSVGLDSGAGNGKYLPTAAEAGHTMIALDRSSGLLEIARRQPGAGDVVRGDLGATCWRDGVFVRPTLDSSGESVGMMSDRTRTL